MDMPNNIPLQCRAIVGSANSCSNIAALVEDTVKINGKDVTVINKGKWDCLTLVQKLTYFKEKTEGMKNIVKADSDKLREATDALERCYLAVSYVDFLKMRQQDPSIPNPEKPFTSPQTNKPVDISTYCGGFNYGQSNSLKECNEICPDSSPQALALYRNCGTCNPGDTACQSNQKLCVERSYNERPCIFSNGRYKDFNECMDKSEEKCTKSCEDRYSSGSNLYNVCKDLCENSEKCVTDNKSACLFSADSLVSAAQQAFTPEDAKSKIDNAYLCKNGSDEYSAYPADCINTNAAIVWLFRIRELVHPLCNPILIP